MASTDSRVAVALLSETREFGEQLRDALVSLGAPVVYEAATGALDRDALERSQANVVVVNLDARNDPDLDEIYRLLDDARYRVIFNDGDVSSGLTGWDHARWLRHLAAKVLGVADLDPPRPADAKAVPVPVVAAAPAAVVALDDAPLETPAVAGGIDALSFAEPVIEEALPSIPLPDPAFLEVAAVDIDLHDFDVPDVQAHAVDDDPFDLDALIAMPAAPSLPGEEAPVTPVATSQAEVDTFDASVFDDFALEFGDDEPRAAPVAGESIHPELHSGLDDFVATAFESAPVVASIDPATDAAPVDMDIDFDAESVPVSPAAAGPAIGGGAHLEWTLEDMLDDLGAPPPHAPAPARPAQPSDFGIEKLSAEEFLAPADDKASAKSFDEPVGLSLELVPLEEAVAPTQVESAARENWLDPDAVKVRRVWVLGASIGGPEAVREFLAAIPRDYPALFLLAQHLGEEFVDMMTNQLAQATPLTVRRAAHGERVGHGEVIVVPTSQRLRVDAQGVVVLERDAGETEFSPSIDRVIRDIADRFGAGAGAIVFSGMSSDAIEGCRHLAGKGGTVYAQRPETCVVSSMVDGVIDTGVVNFLGSPQELAEKLLAAA